MISQTINAEKKVFYDALLSETYDTKIEEESRRVELINSLINLFQESYEDLSS